MAGEDTTPTGKRGMPRTRYTRGLREISSQLTAEVGLEQFLTAVAQIVTGALDAKAASFRVLDTASGELRLCTAFGLSREYLEKGALQAVKSLKEIETGRPVVISDAATDPQVQYREAAAQEGIRTMVGMPFRYSKKNTGVLRVYFPDVREIDEEAIHFLESAVNLTAAALDRSTLEQPVTFIVDAYKPAQIAQLVNDVGVAKANMPIVTSFMLAVLAGAFISLGAVFYTVVITGNPGLGFGLSKLVGGLVFCLGLVLVVVAGAELFTGNNLIVMAAAEGRIPFSKVGRSWAIVFAGNLVGSLATVFLMVLTRQYEFADHAVGAMAVKIAAGKTSLDFVTALARGIMCNALVCLAVWLCFAGRNIVDKVLALLLPITAFVASGFEHCVANMYFIPMGWALKGKVRPEALTDAGLTPEKLDTLGLTGFIQNLIPVTLGNIVGGTIMVGVIYWFVYLYPQRGKAKP